MLVTSAREALDGRTALRVRGVTASSLIVLAAAWSVAMAGPATAHGKQIQLEISSTAAHDVDPLARTFTVATAYQDGEPVDDGQASLTATSASGDTVSGDLRMTDDTPGTFVGTVTFTSAGDWGVSVTITSPFGSGAADFVQAVAPPDPASPASPATTSTPTGVPTDTPTDPGDGTILTQVTFGFGAGDVANIAIRFLHFLSAVLWTALIAATLVGFAWLDGESRITRPTARWLVRLTPWLLGSMVVSGLLQAVRNAPNTGGITEFATLTALPFSGVYVGLLFFKSAMYPVLAVLLWKLRGRLRPLITRAESADLGAGSVVDRAAVVGLAWWSAGVLAAIYAAVLVMNYFHLVSHLAQFYL